MSVGKLDQFSGNGDDFESWVGVFKNYLAANGVMLKKDDGTPDKDAMKKGKHIFLASIGVSTYTLLKQLLSPDAPEKKDLNEIVKVLKEHFKPAPKAISERFRFYKRVQQPGESVSTFIAELRRLAVTCKFEKLDTSLRDQFVCGLSSEAAQRSLFMEDDTLLLEKAVKIATTEEAAERSTQLIRGNGLHSVNMPGSVETTNKIFTSKRSSGRGNSSVSCPACGKGHSKKDCPHKDDECHKCHKKGHFSKFCWSGKKAGTNSKGGKGVNTVNQIGENDEPIYIDVKINGKAHTMEWDTDSGPSFIPPGFWKTLGSPK